jgi:hypothetical protein
MRILLVSLCLAFAACSLQPLGDNSGGYDIAGTTDVADAEATTLPDTHPVDTASDPVADKADVTADVKGEVPAETADVTAEVAADGVVATEVAETVEAVAEVATDVPIGTDLPAADIAEAVADVPAVDLPADESPETVADAAPESTG